ncbi:MAG: hypothetical protein HY553_10040 [Elusimicrobia bacterium]|nr:hypothetical protein [Elusimicrobiota bacterium]
MDLRGLEAFPQIPELKEGPRRDRRPNRGAGVVIPAPAAGSVAAAPAGLAAAGFGKTFAIGLLAVLCVGGTALNVVLGKQKREADRLKRVKSVTDYFALASARTASPEESFAGPDTVDLVVGSELKDAVSGAAQTVAAAAGAAGAAASGAEGLPAFNLGLGSLGKAPKAPLAGDAADEVAADGGEERAPGRLRRPGSLDARRGRRSSGIASWFGAGGPAASLGRMLAGRGAGEPAGSSKARSLSPFAEAFGRSSRMRGSNVVPAGSLRRSSTAGAGDRSKVRLSLMSRRMGEATGSGTQGGPQGDAAQVAQLHTDLWSSGTGDGAGGSPVTLSGMPHAPVGPAAAQAPGAAPGTPVPHAAGLDDDPVQPHLPAATPPPVGGSKDKTPHKDLILAAKITMIVASTLLLAAGVFGLLAKEFPWCEAAAKICAIAALCVSAILVVLGLTIAAIADPMQGLIFSLIGGVLMVLSYIAIPDSSSMQEPVVEGAKEGIIDTILSKIGDFLGGIPKLIF